MAMFPASLFSSPPTVMDPASPPVYGISDSPSGLATMGFLMGASSLKNAFMMVASAPAPVACPAPYDGCVGHPSGKACGSRYEPQCEGKCACSIPPASEFRISALIG